MPNTSMFLRRIFSVTVMAAAAGLLPRFAQAQGLNNEARATQVRDSVLLHANNYRHAMEQQTTAFKVRARRMGQRRRVVRGYAPKNSINPNANSAGRYLTWKHITRTLTTGVVRERYVGYLQGVKVLEETRTNHQTTYVRLHRVISDRNTKLPLGRTKLGLLTSEGYVQWGREQFLLTAPSKL